MTVVVDVVAHKDRDRTNWPVSAAQSLTVADPEATPVSSSIHSFNHALIH